MRSPGKIAFAVNTMLPCVLFSLAIAPTAAAPAPMSAAPVIVPFDFSHNAIGLDVKVKGVPLYMLLDTGVDPSIIDLNRAGALGLKVDREDGGDASGFGGGKAPSVFPSRIDQLALGDRTFASFDALAFDTTGISASYGRNIDGILGYSFLSDKVVLIDYPGHRLGIFDKPGEADGITGTCRKRWSTPLMTVDNFPVITNFRLGAATVPISFDTGSNGGIALFQNALTLPGIRAELIEKGAITHVGARGQATSKSYLLKAPVGMGPFMLPPGQIVTLHGEAAASDMRVANIGNKLFAEMKLKMLLDYPAKTITVFGDCQ